MKSGQEIFDRIERMSDSVGAQFSKEALLEFLPWEQAKGLVKEGVTEAEWKRDTQSLTKDDVTARITEYMPFAWEKVIDHRGISALRSILKFREWLWLLGEDKLAGEIENPFSQYGAPGLAKICEHFRLPIPDTKSVRRMIEGEKCEPQCDEGCGT